MESSAGITERQREGEGGTEKTARGGMHTSAAADWPMILEKERQ